MKFKFENTKKIKKQFYHVKSNTPDIWYDITDKKWKKFEDIPSEHDFATYARCESFKAFKRMLKKNPNLVHATLVSKWIGFDIYQK